MIADRRQRAFVLPLVIMLSLVVGVLVAAMLERQTAQALAVVRQIDTYQEHHTELGVRNLVDGWLKSIPASSLAELSADERHILDITSGDRTYAISLFDAQGTVLMGFAGLEGQQLSRARSVAQAYADLDGEETRDAGPVALSIRSAGREAIEAVAIAVLDGDDQAGDFADRLYSMRNRSDLSESSVATVAAEMGFENDERTALQTLLVISPKLFGVRTSVSGADGEPLGEFLGLAQLQSGQQGAGQPISKGSVFLSWRPGEPIDDE